MSKLNNKFYKKREENIIWKKKNLTVYQKEEVY